MIAGDQWQRPCTAMQSLHAAYNFRGLAPPLCDLLPWQQVKFSVSREHSDWILDFFVHTDLFLTTSQQMCLPILPDLYGWRKSILVNCLCICMDDCSGCRADANEAAIILLPSNITVFTLDFSGSGLSDGNYVSLGWNEVPFQPLTCNMPGQWHSQNFAVRCIFS
jgi:hypothetical protein